MGKYSFLPPDLISVIIPALESIILCIVSKAYCLKQMAYNL